MMMRMKAYKEREDADHHKCHMEMEANRVGDPDKKGGA